MGTPRLDGHKISALVCLAAMLTTARPALADDIPLTTMFDLSAEDTAAREIAYEVGRALRLSKTIKFRDLDESLNIGGEDSQISALKSGDGFLKAGVAKIQKGQFGEAAEDLESSVSSYLEAFAQLPKDSPLPKAMAKLGVAQQMANDEKGAKLSYSRSVQVDPQLEQDFSEYPAKVQALYDKARKEVLARSKIDYDVITVPPNAKIYVNGKYQGLSPHAVGVEPGGRAIYFDQQARLCAKIQDFHRQPLRRRRNGRTQQRTAAGGLRHCARTPDGDFDGAVEANDLTEAEGLVACPYAVAVRVTGTRDKLKVELALANLAGRQVVTRISKELSWMRADKKAIDKMVEELLKSPDVPLDKGQETQTRSVFKTWWFWAIVVGVAGGSAAAYAVASHKTPAVPKYAPGTGGLIIQF